MGKTRIYYAIFIEDTDGAWNPVGQFHQTQAAAEESLNILLQRPQYQACFIAAAHLQLCGSRHGLQNPRRNSSHMPSSQQQRKQDPSVQPHNRRALRLI